MSLAKEQRQKALTEMIRGRKIATQQELQQALEEVGLCVTQASLSRDISELGILKENGCYVLHPASFFQGGALLVLSIVPAGDHLLVIRTPTGSASTVAVGIDEAKMEGVVGTIAGDDTVFVAISSMKKINHIKKEIIKRFRPATGH